MVNLAEDPVPSFCKIRKLWLTVSTVKWSCDHNSRPDPTHIEINGRLSVDFNGSWVTPLADTSCAHNKTTLQFWMAENMVSLETAGIPEVRDCLQQKTNTGKTNRGMLQVHLSALRLFLALPAQTKLRPDQIFIKNVKRADIGKSQNLAQSRKCRIIIQS